MGQLLTKPKTTKSVYLHETSSILAVAAEMQGWRRFMEDAHKIELEDNRLNGMHYFALFDGHSGGEVAKYCSKYLGRLIAKKFMLVLEKQTFGEGKKLEALQICLYNSFLEIDEIMKTRTGQEELERLALVDDGHPELDSQVEALGRFLMERKLLQRNKATQEPPVIDAAKDNNVEEVLIYEPLDDKCPPPAKLRRKRSLTIAGDGELEMGKSRIKKACSLSTTSRNRILESNSVLQEKTHKEEKSNYSSGGTTAIVSIIYDQTLIVANAGDSRCVLSRGGKALCLSKDHKPETLVEHQRIIHAGGFISDGRVNGHLNLSRALGDFGFKNNPNVSPNLQVITAAPDIAVHTIDNELDEFMIMACDGIWECMDSQHVIDFIHEKLRCLRKKYLIEKPTASMCSEVIRELLDHCLSKEKCGHNDSGLGLDNMTAMIILFK